MSQQRLALLVVVGMVLAAGCMDITMTTEVGADGDIESMTVEMEVESMVYMMLEQTAQDEGYDSVEEYLQADMDEDVEGDVQFDDVSVTETDEGKYLITMAATDVDPAALDGPEVMVEEDTVRFEDASMVGADDSEMDDDLDEEFDDDLGMDAVFEEGISITYVLVMPGEIADTNADEVSEDGTTATWSFDGTQQPDEPFYAESSIDEGGDGLPGFGVGVAVTALLLSAAGLRVRSR